MASTSGTTGTPTFYAFTAEDVAVTDGLWARALAQAGVRAGTVVLQGFGLSMFLAGYPLLRAVERMGAQIVPVGAEAGAERLLTVARLTAPGGAAVHTQLCDAPRRAGAGADARAGAAVDHLRRRARRWSARGPGRDRVRHRSYGLRRARRGARDHERLDRCPPLRRDGAARRGLLGAAADRHRHPRAGDGARRRPPGLRRAGQDEPALASATAAANVRRRCLRAAPHHRSRRPRADADQGDRANRRSADRQGGQALSGGGQRADRGVGAARDRPVPNPSRRPAAASAPPLRLRVERGADARQEEDAGLAAEIAKNMHDRLSVRPEVEIVAAGALERTSTRPGSSR